MTKQTAVKAAQLLETLTDIDIVEDSVNAIDDCPSDLRQILWHQIQLYRKTIEKELEEL